jgi:hypothetical protein
LLLIYMTIHLFQFRFGATVPYSVRPPPYLINFEGINPLSPDFLHLFYVTDPSVDIVEVRDIYKLEFDLFQSGGWVVYYCFSVFVFLAHYCCAGRRSFRRASSASRSPTTSTSI